MARKFYMPLFVAMALVALLQGSATATTYTVGDAQGWAVPANGAATYTTWAAGKTFTVGDILGNNNTKISCEIIFAFLANEQCYISQFFFSQIQHIK